MFFKGPMTVSVGIEMIKKFSGNSFRGGSECWPSDMVCFEGSTSHTLLFQLYISFLFSSLPSPPRWSLLTSLFSRSGKPGGDLVYPDATEILERIEDNRYWYNAQVPKHEQERKPGEQSSTGREKRVSWQGTRKDAIDQSEPETSGK